MPGMRLTAGQARRLFGLRSDVCQRILQALVQQGSLSLRRRARIGSTTRAAGRRRTSHGVRVRPVAGILSSSPRFSGIFEVRV